MKNNRSFMRRIQPYLPKAIRYKVFRDKLVINFYISKKLEFRPAKTRDELESAYKILHDSYVENGYAQPHPSGLRIIKHFALPTSTTLIALWEGKVVGTATVIRRSSMGLPLESAFKIDDLIQNGAPVGEISSLAIGKEFRHHRGVIFLPFCKYIFDYAKTCLKLQKMFIAVHPTWADMYEGIFRMERLSPKIVEKYDFAQGNPAVGFYYDDKTTEQRLLETYAIKPLHKNLYNFFYGFQPESFRFPESKYNRVAAPTMTTELFHYFFIERSDVYSQMTDKEKEILFSQYPKEFSKDFYNYTDQRRKEGRFYVDSTATATFILDKKMHVLDISKSGMRIRVDQEELAKFQQKSKNDPLTIIVKVNNRLNSKVTTTVRWIDEKSSQIGLNVIEFDEIWEDYLSYLNSDFEKHKGAA